MAYDEDSGSALSISTVPGAIFMSNRSTMKECLRLKLFGLPSSYQRLVMEIRAGMVLFLFEYEERKLYGVFEATCDGALNIMPHAFTSSMKFFPAQVRFKRLWRCDPLTEREFYPAIKDNYYSHRKFHFDLSEEQVFKLLHLFNLKKKKKGYQKKPSSDMYVEASVPCQTPSPARLKFKEYQGSGSFRKKHKNDDPDYPTSSNGPFLGDVSPSGIRSPSYSKIYGSHISKEKQFVLSESPQNFISNDKDPASPLRGLHQGNLSSPNFLPERVSTSRNAYIEGCNQYNGISSVFQHEQPFIAFSRSAPIEDSENPSHRQHLDSVNLLSSEYQSVNVSSTQDYLCLSRLGQENLSSFNFPRSVSSSSAEAYLDTRSLEDYNTSYLSSFDYERLRGRTEVADVGCRYRQSIYEPHTLTTFRTLRNTQNCEGLRKDALLSGESNTPLYPQKYSQMCKLEDTIQVPRFWDSGHPYTYISDTEISDRGIVSEKTEPLNDSDSLKWQGMYNEEELIMHYPWHDFKTVAADVNTHRLKTSVFSRLSDGRIAKQQEEEYLKMMDDDPSVDQIMSHLAKLRNKFQRSRLSLCRTTAGPEQSSENVKMFPNRTSEFAYEDECHHYIGVHSKKRITKLFNFKHRSEACKIGDRPVIRSSVNQKRKLARPSFSQVPLGNGNSKHQDGKIRDCQISRDVSKAGVETDIASDHENINEIDKCKGISGTARRRNLARPSFSQVSPGNGNSKHPDAKIRDYQILGDACSPKKEISETNIATDHANINEIDKYKGIAGTTRRKLTRPSFSQVSLGNGNSRHQDGKIRDCQIFGDPCASNKASSETDIALACENVNKNNESKEKAGTGGMPVHQIKRRKLTRPSFSQVSLENENSKHQAGNIKDFQILGDASLSNKESSENDIAPDHENTNEIDKCNEIAGTDRTPAPQIKRRKLIRPTFSEVSLGNGNSKHQDGKIRDCQMLGDAYHYNKASSEKYIASDHENIKEIDECKGIARTGGTPAHLGTHESAICINCNPELSPKTSVRKTEELSKGCKVQAGEPGDACSYNKASSENGTASDHENINEIDECKEIAGTGRTSPHLGTYESEVCSNHNPEFSSKTSVRKTEELSKECEAHAGELFVDSLGVPFSFTEGGFKCQTLQNSFGLYLESYGLSEKVEEKDTHCTKKSNKLEVDRTGSSKKILYQDEETPLIRRERNQKGSVFYCSDIHVHAAAEPTSSRDENHSHSDTKPLLSLVGFDLQNCSDNRVSAKDAFFPGANTEVIDMQFKYDINEDVPVNLDIRRVQQLAGKSNNMKGELHAMATSREVKDLSTIMEPYLPSLLVDCPNFNYNQVNERSVDMPNGEIDFQNRKKSMNDVPAGLDDFITRKLGRSVENPGDKGLHVETGIMTSGLSATKNSVDNTSNDVSGSMNIFRVHGQKIAKVNDVTSVEWCPPECRCKDILAADRSQKETKHEDMNTFLVHRQNLAKVKVETSVEWCPPECRYEDILAAGCSQKTQKEIKQEDVPHSIDVNDVLHDSGNRVPHGNEENIPLFDVLKGNFLEYSNCSTELSVVDDYLGRSSWEHATENMKAASPLDQ